MAFRMHGTGGTALITVPCPNSRCEHPGAVIASFYAFVREIEDAAELEEPENAGQAVLQLWCPKCGLVKSVDAWPEKE